MERGPKASARSRMFEEEVLAEAGAFLGCGPCFKNNCRLATKSSNISCTLTSSSFSANKLTIADSDEKFPDSIAVLTLGVASLQVFIRSLKISLVEGSSSSGLV